MDNFNMNQLLEDALQAHFLMYREPLLKSHFEPDSEGDSFCIDHPELGSIWCVGQVLTSPTGCPDIVVDRVDDLEFKLVRVGVFPTPTTALVGVLNDIALGTILQRVGVARNR